MSYYDGGVLGVQPLHESGDVSERFNLVIMSEGYQYYQLGQFYADALSLRDRFLATEPFASLSCHFNLFRIDVWSLDAGADDPYDPTKGCTGTGVAPRTFFDATFCGQGIERLIAVNSPLVEWVLGWYAPWAHSTVILVNAAKEGGNGYQYATVSKGAGWDWAKVAIHELGHAAFNLGDEYDFLTSCDDNRYHYVGPEPEWPNVTKDATPEGLKWSDFVKAETPLPTQKNPNCTKCNDSAAGYPPGTVGAFEGAGLFHCDLYRPEEDCLMRFADGFCAVCASVIEAEFAPHAPECLAPLFDQKTGFAGLIKRIVLSIKLWWMSLTDPKASETCSYRQTLFELHNCHIGNDDACVDLGGT